MASTQDIQEINLHVDGQVFKTNKNVLCEHSDYFSAMFSGNYVEKEKKDITIDVIDAKSMDIILRYMNKTIDDLSDFSLEAVETLALAANFLQITELNKQIVNHLVDKLSVSSWVDIMNIAKKAAYIKLEHHAGSYGLLAFKNMEPQYIPNIQTLVWYLSHPYLDTENELNVFKFGYNWIVHAKTGVADNLFLLFGCLDVPKLRAPDLHEILLLMADSENSFAFKVIESFKMILDRKLKVNSAMLTTHGENLRGELTDSVYNELLDIVEQSNARQLRYTAVISLWFFKNSKLERESHHLHVFNEIRGFQKWSQIGEKHSWGWNLAAWGPTKLVLCCGEIGRGTGRFMRNVRVYDALKEKWTTHVAKLLPPKRHAGVAVCGDSLFVVAGVGIYRLLDDSTIIYNLKDKTIREGSKFPEAIQSPAICSHQGAIYAAGQKHIYKYVDEGGWVSIMRTDIRLKVMASFKNHIYCSQGHYNNMYRFRPGVDDTLEHAAEFESPIVAFCNLGDHLLVFTRSPPALGGMLTVEMLTWAVPVDLWAEMPSDITINDVAGACGIVMSIPKITNIPSSYLQKHLTQYADAAKEKENVT